MSARGFTLLELLVVMAILGLAIGLALPRLSDAVSGPRLVRMAHGVAADLRRARSRAVTTNRQVSLVIDLAERQVQVTGEPRDKEIPDDYAVTLETIAVERISELSGGIRFFPDGSSTGGRITLAEGSRESRIDVDWLTGRVRVSE